MKSYYSIPVVAILVLSFLAVGAIPSGAPFVVRKDDSRVTFELTKWSVFKEEGRFKEFSGEIHYHPDEPTELRVEFEVDVRSVDTQNRNRDRRLMQQDFFDAQQYPRMTFKSRSAKVLKDGTYAVTGDLTIKGETQQITIPVTPLGTNRIDDLGTIAGFETHFQIDRMDYGVSGHRWSDGKNILGHDVDIRLLVSAQQK